MGSGNKLGRAKWFVELIWEHENIQFCNTHDKLTEHSTGKETDNDKIQIILCIINMFIVECAARTALICLSENLNSTQLRDVCVFDSVY
jgi:hypothetical protein